MFKKNKFCKMWGKLLTVTDATITTETIIAIPSIHAFFSKSNTCRITPAIRFTVAATVKIISVSSII